MIHFYVTINYPYDLPTWTIIFVDAQDAGIENMEQM